MAFKGGTPIQAGLGRADFSPLVRAGEFTGQGYANLGAGLSQGINQLSEMQKQKKEEEKKAKTDIAAAKAWMGAVKTMKPDKPGDTPKREDIMPGMTTASADVSKQYQQDTSMFDKLEALEEMLNDENVPLNQRGAMAGQVANIGKIIFGSAMEQMTQAPPKPSPFQSKGLFTAPGVEQPFEGVFSPDIGQTLMRTPQGFAQMPSGYVPYAEPSGVRLTSPAEYATPDGEIIDTVVHETLGRSYYDEAVGEYKRVPKEWDEIRTSVLTGELPTFDQLKETRDKLIQAETALININRYVESRGGARQGLKAVYDDMSFKIKTLIDSGEITEEEMARAKAKGQFEGLLGKLRLEVVGGGVMTEPDAQRIMRRMGGINAFLSNPEVATQMMAELYEDKMRDYDRLTEDYNFMLNQRPKWKKDFKTREPIQKHSLLSEPPVITTQEEYDALPVGTPYVNEAGDRGVKK